MDKPSGLDRKEFDILMGQLNLRLNVEETDCMFKKLDVSKNMRIEMTELNKLLMAAAENVDEHGLNSDKMLASIIEKINSVKKATNDKYESDSQYSTAEQRFRNFINKIEVKETDFYKGSRTILRDPYKALKVAQQYVDDVIANRDKSIIEGTPRSMASLSYFIDKEFGATIGGTGVNDMDIRGIKSLVHKDLLVFDAAGKEVGSTDPIIKQKLENEWKAIKWIRPNTIVSSYYCDKQKKTDKKGDKSDKKGKNQGNEDNSLEVPTFFATELETTDVNQGDLNNCWLITALSIVARRPEYLRGRVTKTKNDMKDKETINEEDVLYASPRLKVCSKAFIHLCSTSSESTVCTCSDSTRTVNGST